MLQHRYSAVAIGLHWAIAFGILGMIAMGWYMGDLPNDDTSKVTLYQLHKSVGISLLLLAIARICWRLMNPPPEAPAMQAWQSLAAKLVHIVYYGLMITLPLTGWMMVSASERGLPTVLFDMINWPHIAVLANLTADTKEVVAPILANVHSKQAWLVILLLFLHVGGAIKHQFLERDHLMARMAPVAFGRTAGPPTKPRGAWLSFGASLAFFVLIIGLGQMGGQAQAEDPVTPSSSADVEIIEPNWLVDAERSEITATGQYDGAPYALLFSDWTADIYHAPSLPAAAQIKTTIDMTSITVLEAASKSYVRNALSGEDFFDSNNHPTATFTASGIHPGQDREFELTGVLNFRGTDFPVRLPFDLQINDGEAVMSASITLNRLDLGFGVKNDASADWIDEEFDLNFKLVANLQTE